MKFEKKNQTFGHFMIFIERLNIMLFCPNNWEKAPGVWFQLFLNIFS